MPSIQSKVAEPKQRACALCRREGIDPPADGDLVAGTKRDEYGFSIELRPWRGYVCEMHLENFETYRFL